MKKKSLMKMLLSSSLIILLLGCAHAEQFSESHVPKDVSNSKTDASAIQRNMQSQQLMDTMEKLRNRSILHGNHHEFKNR
jgi:hypothetical protein